MLKRILGRLPGTTQPEWSRPPEASALVPMLLAGSWDENSEADRSAMARLSGRPYEDFAEVADRWRTAPDSPLMRIGSRWSLVSRNDSWHLLASAVTREALGRFKQVALEVLAEDDPAYEAPPDRRWMARLHQRGPRFSPSLRAGLAETLAILGTRPGRLDGISELKAWSHEVDRIVRELLINQLWVRWASLSDQLPLLAEASPNAFLAADRAGSQDERNRRSSSCSSKRSGTLLALNPHVGLLSSLEVLAWSSEHLPRVGPILAALDEKAPPRRVGEQRLQEPPVNLPPWNAADHRSRRGADQDPEGTRPAREGVGLATPHRPLAQ